MSILLRRIFILFSLFVLPQIAHSTYIRTWSVCGPFEDDIETDHLNGTEMSVIPGPQLSYNGRRWRIYSSFSDEISVGGSFFIGAQASGCIYANVFILADEACEARLLTGSSGKMKVVLNSKNILTLENGSKFKLDRDKVRIRLNKGGNRLMIKTTAADGAWNFSCNIVDLYGNPIKGLSFKPDPENLSRIPVRKIIYSSVDENNLSNYTPANLLDNDESTLWSSAHSDNQWATFCFKWESELSRIVLVWDKRAYARSYLLETSGDGINWRMAYQNSAASGAKEDIMLASPIKCSYVRLHCLERGTEAGNALYETYLFGPSGPGNVNNMNNSNVVPVEEDKDSQSRRLIITNYPKVIVPGENAVVDIEWKDAPSQEEYKLIVQVEKLDFLPPACAETTVPSFGKQGKKTVVLPIPYDFPRFEGFRFVAAFISRQDDWQDTYDVTNTPKNVKANE